MLLRKKLQDIRLQKDAEWNIIELDYALSWVLAAITEYAPAKNDLIFKGGTCLKKCYFGPKYRFSEDLDFSAPADLSDETLDLYLNHVVRIATELSEQSGGGVRFELGTYGEKSPHPFNQKAYTLRAQFPWHREPLTKIKFEVSRDETLVYPPVQRPILHEYGEKLEQQIQAYSLEEILTEKFRGILQNQERLKIKGWIRSRVRDFYDLWHILTEFKNEINLEDFKVSFVKKCASKEIDFDSPEQFFNNQKYLTIVERDWGTYLGNLVTDLPSFDDTINQLKILTVEVFKDK